VGPHQKKKKKKKRRRKRSDLSRSKKKEALTHITIKKRKASVGNHTRGKRERGARKKMKEREQPSKKQEENRTRGNKKNYTSYLHREKGKITSPPTFSRKIILIEKKERGILKGGRKDLNSF